MRTDSQVRSAARDPRSNWLISFGDLLTLLLAFFVASVAAGGGLSKKGQGDQALTDPQGAPQGGTMLAADQRGSLVGQTVDVALSQSELEQVDLSIDIPMGVDRVKHSVLATVCGRTSELAGEGIINLSRIRQELEASGVPSHLVQIELSATCQEMATANGGMIAATLRWDR